MLIDDLSINLSDKLPGVNKSAWTNLWHWRRVEDAVRAYQKFRQARVTVKRLLAIADLDGPKKGCTIDSILDYHPLAMRMTGTQPGIPVDGGFVTRHMDWLRLPRSVTLSMLVRVMLCALGIAGSIGPLQAQKGHPDQPAPPPPVSSPNPSPGNGAQSVNPADPTSLGIDPLSPPALPSVDTTEMINAEACDSWTESGVRSPTISTTRLGVPGKASSEYQKGCGAYKDQKLPQAEEHIRKAITVYPDYAAAWVVLGQVLNAKHERDKAREACSQGSRVDPKYVAPYLCLAEFAAIESDWEQVARLSERALALDPVNNVYSLYYAAYASAHLHQFHEAEVSALAATQLDRVHHLPQLHLLLAEIYAAKGDTATEVVELRQYLKLAPNSQNTSGAKDTLAEIESRPSK
jgi:hypothetical protein